MRSLFLFILVLSTASASSYTLEKRAVATPVCDSGEPVCCDGDLFAEDVGVLVGCDHCKHSLDISTGQIKLSGLPFLIIRLAKIMLRGLDIADASSADNENLAKCEHPEMIHCCLQVISGVGLSCGNTAAQECPVPGVESRKRHLRRRAGDGCSPPVKPSQANMDYPVADTTLDLNGGGSSDLFLADGASPDLSTDQSLRSPTALDGGTTTVALGGGELPAASYGDGALSLPLLDDTSGGANDGTGSPNMFLDG